MLVASPHRLRAAQKSGAKGKTAGSWVRLARGTLLTSRALGRDKGGSLRCEVREDDKTEGKGNGFAICCLTVHKFGVDIVFSFISFTLNSLHKITNNFTNRNKRRFRSHARLFEEEERVPNNERRSVDLSNS